MKDGIRMASLDVGLFSDLKYARNINVMNCWWSYRYTDERLGRTPIQPLLILISRSRFNAPIIPNEKAGLHAINHLSLNNMKHWKHITLAGLELRPVKNPVQGAVVWFSSSTELTACATMWSDSRDGWLMRSLQLVGDVIVFNGESIPEHKDAFQIAKTTELIIQPEWLNAKSWTALTFHKSNDHEYNSPPFVWLAVILQWIEQTESKIEDTQTRLESKTFEFLYLSINYARNLRELL